MSSQEATHITVEQEAEPSPFQGFKPPTSSTTYTPNQFFDVALPTASRGCLRLVAYLIRKTLGWSDEQGNPQNPNAHVSYRELIESAGISRGAIKDAIEEALAARYIQCIRFGQPHQAGVEGFSALYSLKWDDKEEYTTDPEKFEGFFSGNGNLTHIPNQFFDEVVPNEPLAVVRVVGAVIRNTIGFQTKFGFRRQQVQLSFTEIMRKTGISSSSTVSGAIKSAVAQRFISKVEEGVFDPCAGASSKATTFSIRWQDDSTIEPKSEDGSKIEVGTLLGSRTSLRKTVQKPKRKDGSNSEAATVQKSKREEFKNRSDIETTQLNNTIKQQQPVVDESGLLSEDLLKRLTALGLEQGKAVELVRRHPGDRILKQLEALPHRRIQSSVTGFIISAIEQDYPLPVITHSPSSLFASHFYAELAGNQGEPASLPSALDEAAAQKLLALVKAEDAGTAGRAFARYVVSHDGGKSSASPSLASAARKFGDRYSLARKAAISSERERQQAREREAHQAEHEEAYRMHLRLLATVIEEEEGEAWSGFTKWMNARMERGALLSERYVRQCREQMKTKEGRAELLTEYLEQAKPGYLPGFWQWDASVNSSPFSFKGENDK